MNKNELFELWDRFESSSVEEMYIEAEGFSFCLKKNKERCSDNEPKRKISPKVEHSTINEELNHSDTLCDTQVKTSLAGIFYRAPEPNAEPFVSLDKRVRKGDVIGIVEAMKMMNEITAPTDGIISSIQVQDGDMVEYDQVLVTIKESSC